MSRWSHAPAHHTSEPGWYFITGGTYLKKPFLAEEGRRTAFVDLLKRLATEFTFELQAWVVMINHYHLLLWSAGAPNIPAFIRKLHSKNAHDINAADCVTGRRVWYQYWDETVRTENACLSHVNYIHENPVHHRVERVAENYRWSSAREFEARNRTLAKAVREMKIDQIDVFDKF
jgi:putative transposase